MFGNPFGEDLNQFQMLQMKLASFLPIILNQEGNFVLQTCLRINVCIIVIDVLNCRVFWLAFCAWVLNYLLLDLVRPMGVGAALVSKTIVGLGSRSNLRSAIAILTLLRFLSKKNSTPHQITDTDLNASTYSLFCFI